MITEQSGNVIAMFATFIAIISSVNCWFAETKLKKLLWATPVIACIAAVVGADVYLGHF